MGNKEFSRARRVAEQMRRDLAEIIARDVADPRIEKMTLSSIKVSADLSHARVFFTLPEDEDVDATLAALKRASGYLRHALSERLRLRITPRLTFVFDHSLEQALRIAKLLDTATYISEEEE